MANQWDALAQDMAANAGKGAGFYKFQIGDNKMRLLEVPVVTASHYLPSTKKSIACIKAEGVSCDLCNKGEKRRVQYMANAIIRADQTVQFVKFPGTPVQQLLDIKKDPEWAGGFDEATGLPLFDINVKKTKTGSDDKDVEYSLVPSPNRVALTPEEEEKRGLIKPAAEVIQKMIDKARSEADFDAAHAAEMNGSDANELDEAMGTNR